MTYAIEYDKQPQKFLEKIPKHIAGRIIDKVEESLHSNPVPHDAKSIVGEHGVFRLRLEITEHCIGLIILSRKLLCS